MSDQIQFVAPILRRDTGMLQHYLPLPTEVAADLRRDGVRRVIASFNGVKVNRGVVGDGEGGWILIVSLDLMKEMRCGLGDMVAVQLQPDPDPDSVELCEEFQVVLDMDKAAQERYQLMTPGRQRGLAYYVNSAKREETRIRRALQMAEKLRTNTLYGDRDT